MDFYKDIPIYDPDTAAGRDVLLTHDGTYSLRPRDFAVDPPEMMADPSGIELIPESEYDARWEEQEKHESSLEHIFLRGGKPAFVNLDQGRDGDCWAYSTGHGKMLSDLRDNRPPVRVNPHFIAAHLRRYDGGWCGASAKVLREVGILPEGTGPGEWPKWSHRAPTPADIAAAAKYRSTEDWYDLTRPVHGQVLTERQRFTCSFSNMPCPSDYNFMSHSVCLVRKVRIERGDWGDLYLNSWLGFGRFGLAVLRGNKARADGAVVIRW